MRTLYLSCTILIIVCSGCSNHKLEARIETETSVIDVVKAPELEAECEKESVDLTVIPPQYGKPIKGSSGQLIYCIEWSRTFRASIALNGLEGSHSYLLTLNSRPGRPGFENLPEEYNRERYYDFKEITTNKDGSYEDQLKRRLKPGDYEVKFLVKDKYDWKTVLHSDFLFFTITE